MREEWFNRPSLIPRWYGNSKDRQFLPNRNSRSLALEYIIKDWERAIQAKRETKQ